MSKWDLYDNKFNNTGIVINDTDEISKSLQKQRMPLQLHSNTHRNMTKTAFRFSFTRHISRANAIT